MGNDSLMAWVEGFAARLGPRFAEMVAEESVRRGGPRWTEQFKKEFAENVGVALAGKWILRRADDLGLDFAWDGALGKYLVESIENDAEGWIEAMRNELGAGGEIDGFQM